VRNFPRSSLTEKAVQCDFCERQIRRCNQGTYSTLVGLDRNPETFETSRNGIRVSQANNLPSNLPITKIYPEEHKKYVNDKMIVVFKKNLCKDSLSKIHVINRETGEQISIKM
jgi:hypothetical protein